MKRPTLPAAETAATAAPPYGLPPDYARCCNPRKKTKRDVVGGTEFRSETNAICLFLQKSPKTCERLCKTRSRAMAFLLQRYELSDDEGSASDDEASGFLLRGDTVVVRFE